MEYLIRIWHSYPALLDFMLYFLVFGAAAQVGFAKSFPSHEGKVLAVAVGLFLAACLAIAQRKLGFSLERMGPVAAFLLCGVIFIAAYRFMKHADVPMPLTVLLSGLMALALARAVMPEATGRFMRENPLIVLLVLLGVIYWAWHSSEGYLGRIAGRRPGHVLGKQHVVPDEGLLRKEARYLKRNLRNETRKERKEERTVKEDLKRAQQTLERGPPDKASVDRASTLVDRALTKANHIQQHCEKLLRLDSALRRFDRNWLKKAHAFSLDDLTPEQQKLVRDSIIEERRRIRTEENLAALQAKVNAHVQAMKEYARRARAGLASGSAVGAVGWIPKAIEEEKAAEELESEIMNWERRLIGLVKRQRSELERAD